MAQSAIAVVRLDAAWSEESQYHAGELRAIRFVRESGKRAKLLLTPLVPVPDEALLGPAPELVELVQAGPAAELAPQSVEKKLAVEQRRAGDVELVVVTATDAAPKPGEFRRVTTGIARLHGIPFSLTILFDEPAARDELFAAMRSWSGFGAPERALPEVRPDRAALEAACQRGDGLACGLVNELLAQDEAGKDSYFKRASAGCNAGSVFACSVLGSLYAEGHGVAADVNKALALFVRACDGHSGLGCLNAIKMVAQKRGRLPKGASADPMFYADRACWYGSDRDGVCRATDDSDAKPADYLAQKIAGCARGDARACRLLGWARETAYGTSTDVAGAVDAYGKACDKGDLYGCFRRALFTSDLTEQGKLLGAACERGSGPACYDLALPTYGVAAAQRATLWRRACESDIEPACLQVAATLAAPASPK
jgi:TPR repeat protein